MLKTSSRASCKALEPHSRMRRESESKRRVLNVTFFFVCEQMSFVRVGRPLQHNKGKKSVRPKRTAPKKEWVVSIILATFRVTYLYDSVAFLDRLKYRHFVFPVNPHHITVTSVV